jgi:hypothetical protein
MPSVYDTAAAGPLEAGAGFGGRLWEQAAAQASNAEQRSVWNAEEWNLRAGIQVSFSRRATEKVQ